MVSERDIYASAYQLIKEHGNSALDHATNRMQSLAEEHDLDGMFAWVDIIQAIKDLEAIKERKNLQ